MTWDEAREEQARFDPPAAKPAAEWAIVELLGHRRLAGRLSEVERFGCKMGRLDIPQKDGSFVTQFFGGQSVYAITHVTERVARDVATRCDAAPVQPWDYPKALPAADPATDPASIHSPVRHFEDGRIERDDDEEHDPDDPDMPRW